jgi:hypothetical protein
MKVGDLVTSRGIRFIDYGIGIVTGVLESKIVCVYWPQEGFWSLTRKGDVKPL